MDRIKQIAGIGVALRPKARRKEKHKGLD